MKPGTVVIDAYDSKVSKYSTFKKIVFKVVIKKYYIEVKVDIIEFDFYLF